MESSFDVQHFLNKKKFHMKNSVKPQEQYQLNHLKNEDSWCVSDFSLISNNRIVLSGSKHATRETFIKVFSVAHSDTQSKPKCLYTREFNIQDHPEQWRLVSFLDTLNLVTCFDNRVEKISIRNDKIVQSKKLTTDGASCISVRGTKIFIGFTKSSSVVVLNSNLNQTSTITLNALEDGWPVDLVVVPDYLLVCSFGCVPRRALVVSEKDGELLREYTNPRSDDSVPLSLTVSAEADLVAVLWNSPPQLTIHSFSHGHCLVAADVEPAERVRSVGQDKLLMVDEQGELKVFQMGQFFTMENLKATLSCSLSYDDCKELTDFFGVNFDPTEQTNGGQSPSERVEDDDQSSEAQKLDFFRCLEENDKMHYGNVTDLIRACNQLKKGRTLLGPLEAYEKYGGDCESRLIIDSGPCSTSQDPNRAERGDVGVKRRHTRDDPPLPNGSKRKRIDKNATEADNELPTSDLNQQGLADTITKAVKEAIEPLLGEIQSLKQQNDLMMCYLRTQPFQHSSSHHCSCFSQCRPPSAQPCTQLHPHACSHVAQQPCTNLHMQCGNGVPPNPQPNLPQQSQQQLLVPLPPHQSVAPQPQVLIYSHTPAPLQPNRQLPPSHSNHLQAVSNYYPTNPPLNFYPPDHRQSTTMTVSSAQSARQQTHAHPSTSMQTPVQVHTGITSTCQTQGYQTPGLNGATNPSDGFGSPPSLQPYTNVPPQGNIQGTPATQQLSSVPLDSPRPSGEPPHNVRQQGNIQGTPATQQLSSIPLDSSRPSSEPPHNVRQQSVTATPIQAPNQGEVLNLPGHSTEGGVLSPGQGGSLPTKLSDLPRHIQLKLLPCEGQKNETDRQHVTKILLKYFFSHDERLVGNTSGKRGYRELRTDKLLGMRDLIFKICPLDEEENELEQEKEWRELCNLIDTNNRRYRSELKTGRSKKKSQKSAKS